jgi:hypothetical protein
LSLAERGFNRAWAQHVQDHDQPTGAPVWAKFPSDDHDLEAGAESRELVALFAAELGALLS